MPDVIENNAVGEDTRVLIDRETNDASLLANKEVIVPLSLWVANQSESVPAAIWLDSDELPELPEAVLDQIDLIAINFPVFTDGRGYSFAYRLRHDLGYKGKLRAVGDVLIDQLTALKRVGFDSFALREDQDLSEALKHFADFTEPYQASVEPAEPLYLRAST